MNLDDPNLTAYALDELPEAERRAVEAAVAQSPEAQAFVRQTREMAQLVRDEFQADLQSASRKPISIMPLPMPRSFWSDARWLSVGIAALLAVAAVITAVVLSNGTVDQNSRLARLARLPVTSSPPMQMEVEGLEATVSETGFADASGDNPFINTAANPVSRISFRVGGNSYEDVRGDLRRGTKPARESVRLEQLINHFSYDYPTPAPNERFAIALEAGGCPWQPRHRLVRVAVKGREARGVQLTATFNPEATSSYRLLGYENRGQLNEDENENLRDEQTLTALYEVVPNESESQPAAPLVSVTLTYKLTDKDPKRAIQHATLKDYGPDFAQAPVDFRFAAAVAEFGMILRDSPHKGNSSLREVLAWSNESKGRDQNGERAEFIELVRMAQRVTL